MLNEVFGTGYPLKLPSLRMCLWRGHAVPPLLSHCQDPSPVIRHYLYPCAHVIIGLHVALNVFTLAN